jgi:hypothetical protein
MTQLVACPSCSRHVRVGSAACPFCGGAPPEPRVDRGDRFVIELTRSAIVAGSLALSACSSSPPVSIALPYGSAVMTYTGSETVPDGIVFGETVCEGEIYFDFAGGYIYCDDGIWDWGKEDPTSYGGSWTYDQSLQVAAASQASSITSARLDSSSSSGTSSAAGSTSSSGSESTSSSKKSRSQGSEAPGSSSGSS